MKTHNNTYYGKLLKPGRIGTMQIKNRMVMPGITTNLAGFQGGVSDAIVNYYARRGNGGVGLVITEIAYVAPKNGFAHGALFVSDDGCISGLSRISHAIHSGGAKACLQLAQKAHFMSPDTIKNHQLAPSAVKCLHLPHEDPKEMTIGEIEELVQSYGAAAERARKCGFDSVELHGAHGYLPLEFFSGYTNRRNDKYGGSTENRARFILEAIRCIKECAGRDFPLLYRMSAEEYVPEGVTIEQSLQLAKWVEEAGADAVHVTAGTTDSRLQKYCDVIDEKCSAADTDLNKGVSVSAWIPSHYSPRGQLVDLAAAVKQRVRIPILAVCGITPEMGETILEKGDADFISFGRQSVADPDWAQKIIDGKPKTIRRCLRCNECIASIMEGRTLTCTINPEAGKEGLSHLRIVTAKKPKKIAVVGSGPAGTHAAIVASQRGHIVTLFEKDSELGGMLNILAIPDFKEEYRDYLKYLLGELQTGDIKIVTKTEVDADLLKRNEYDKIIVATGSTPLIPHIKGLEYTLDPLEILKGHYPNGENAIVCGAGLVGTEVALLLAEMGKKVTIIDLLPEANPNVMIYDRWVINARLKKLGIEIKLSHRIEEITESSVKCRARGNEIAYRADAVICALGMKSNSKLLGELRKELPRTEIVSVGDINSVGKVIHAVHEGFHAGRRA